MKKLLLLMTFLLTVLLAACDQEPQPLDYSDFEANKVSSYSELENKTDHRYIAYYYSESCSHCAAVKTQILTFFSTYADMPFYLLDVAYAPDRSGIDEFYGTPTIFVMSDGEVVDSFSGDAYIRQFLTEYTTLQYLNFSDQHLTTYDEVLNINEDSYLLYYYEGTNPDCISIKSDFLSWAISRSVDEVYFMNGLGVINPDEIPSELQILTTGAPLLLVMSNGEYTGVSYSGVTEILHYINTVEDGDLVIDN